MSAMHWEARRRQTALDRRMARDKQPLLHMRSCSDTISNATKPNATQDHLAGSQHHCEGDLKVDDHHNPKIPNRFSSLQYSQQW